MFRWFRNRRRRKIKARPFPQAWRDILQSGFLLSHRLPPRDLEELESLIQVFLEEKSFEGCGGLTITDEIRVLVAAQACLLLLRRDNDNYPGLKSILVYPTSYFSPEAHYSDHGVVTEQHEERLGESWDIGAVVLAWNTVQADASRPNDGHNVVFHEFAHQLDQQSGTTDGTPPLGRDKPYKERLQLYESWAETLSQNFEDLQDQIERRRKTLMDPYGASHPAEFFAVATECFFEKPVKLRKRRPDLYAELKAFYHQDPAEW